MAANSAGDSEVPRDAWRNEFVRGLHSSGFAFIRVHSRFKIRDGI
jgi:hypothetical protein